MLTVFPLEDTVDIVAHSLPHGHVTRVVELHSSFIFIKSKMKDTIV